MNTRGLSDFRAWAGLDEATQNVALCDDFRRTSHVKFYNRREDRKEPGS